MKRVGPFLTFAAVFSLCAVEADAGHLRTLSLPWGGRIEVDVPAGYSFETERTPDGAVAYKMENPVWQISVRGVVIPESDPANTTAEWQRNHIITFMADALSIAAEKDYNFKPLYPETGSGTYLVFTDPRVANHEPMPPGEAANLTGGLKAWRGVTVVFQILSNSVESEEYQEIMRVFTESFSER